MVKLICFELVQNVGAAPLLRVPSSVCYCYTTFCKYLIGTGEWSRTTVTSVSERHNNRYMTPAYTRRIKITYQFPKQMLIYKLLKPSLCMVRVRGLEPPEYGVLGRSLYHSSTPANITRNRVLVIIIINTILLRNSG